MKEYLLPVKIVESKGVVCEEGLFVPKGMHSLHDMDEEHLKSFTKLEGLGSYIVLDFGKEMNGGVRLLTGWVTYCSCKARIRFGESLGEVNSSVGYKNATNDHSPRDFENYICASADYTLGQTGFRYVRIDLLEDKFAYFRNIYCVNNILNKKAIYSYQGNDQRIKEIFLTAKRTVDLCSSSGYIWDGVKRDRLVWVGDLAPEIMALSTLYGRLPVVERTLTLAKKTTPLPKYMNDLFTYSMWWLIILGDYYRDFKCDDYIKKNIVYAQNLVKQLHSLVDENGDLTGDKRFLVDWPTVGSEDEIAGVKAIFLMSLNSAIYLFNEFNVDATIAKQIKERLLLKPITVKEKKQVIALKYFALGEISNSEYQTLIKGGANGLSTFMSYYILTAIASRDKRLAIEIMKDFYGGMLDRGATTFWEDFNMEWLKDSGSIDCIDSTKKDIHGDFGAHCYVGYRHSLCHGWSAGVIRFIKENC